MPDAREKNRVQSGCLVRIPCWNFCEFPWICRFFLLKQQKNNKIFGKGACLPYICRRNNAYDNIWQRFAKRATEEDEVKRRLHYQRFENGQNVHVNSTVDMTSPNKSRIGKSFATGFRYHPLPDVRYPSLKYRKTMMSFYFAYSFYFFVFSTERGV